MAPTEPAINNRQGEVPGDRRDLEYHITMLETPLPLVSLYRQVREPWHTPKVAVNADHSSHESVLPLSDMRPWYRDLPAQIGSLFEDDKPPALSLSSRSIEVPEIWRDFQPHPASWGNALLAHVLAVTAMILPLALKNMLRPVEIPKRSFGLTKIFLPADLPAVGEQPRGGGGGGDRTPLPASRGAIPRFAPRQFAPPRAKLPVVPPLLPVEPTLVGAPDLKLSEMAPNVPWGDPAGTEGPDSSGPGSRGSSAAETTAEWAPARAPATVPAKAGIPAVTNRSSAWAGV